MSVSMKMLAVVLISVAVVIPVPAHSWTGKVVGVSDGDTITVLTEDKQQIKVRIYGVDCPEKGQDFGSKAKQFTSDQVFGKTVEIDPITIDRYGRTIGIVEMGGANLSRLIIESGMGWVYDDYCKMLECDEWRKLQDLARSRKVGIWSIKNPTPPWDFRHAEKKKEIDRQDSSAERTWSPSTRSDPSPQFGAGGRSPRESTGSTWVNSYTRKDGTVVRGHYRSGPSK